MIRKCYQCEIQIKDIQGKYFCSRECWEKYGENFKKIPSRLTIKEIQTKLLELGKSAPKKPDIIKEAERLFT